MQIFLFFGLIIAILAVLFAIQNPTTVTIQFLGWEFESSLALLLLVAMAAGALISFLLSSPSYVRTRWTSRSQRKRLTEMETSLADQKLKLEALQKQLDEKGQAEAANAAQPPAWLTQPGEAPSSPAQAEVVKSAR